LRDRVISKNNIGPTLKVNKPKMRDDRKEYQEEFSNHVLRIPRNRSASRLFVHRSKEGEIGKSPYEMNGTVCIVSEQVEMGRVYHSKCNRTTFTYYGTKIKSETGPPPCKTLPTSR
jgi:hypothetical protein